MNVLKLLLASFAGLLAVGCAHRPLEGCPDTETVVKLLTKASGTAWSEFRADQPETLWVGDLQAPWQSVGNGTEACPQAVEWFFREREIRNATDCGVLLMYDQAPSGNTCSSRLSTIVVIHTFRTEAEAFEIGQRYVDTMLPGAERLSRIHFQQHGALSQRFEAGSEGRAWTVIESYVTKEQSSYRVRLVILRSRGDA